jgi:NADPH-dependent 2,4-dienoyl-CoA reductase/sulfur reductase-like enzyme
MEIEVKLNSTVAAVESSSVVLSNKTKIQFDHLVLATGGEPRLLPIKNKDLRNIFPLRSVNDANNIHSTIQSVKEPHVVIIGSSFIGMEAAASLKKSSKSVTVVGMEKVQG